MTTTESDGFVTVTPMNTAKRFQERYSQAALNAHIKAGGSDFYLMLAYKHGHRDTLEQAREKLAEAVAILDAALVDTDAAKVAALQAARKERRGEG